MKIKLIKLYCFICYLYDSNQDLKEQRLSNFKPKFIDQEIITYYFLAMLNNHQKIQAIYDYICYHWLDYFLHLPSYQTFNYWLNYLFADFAIIFNTLLQNQLCLPNLDFIDNC